MNSVTSHPSGVNLTHSNVNFHHGILYWVQSHLSHFYWPDGRLGYRSIQQGAESSVQSFNTVSLYSLFHTVTWTETHTFILMSYPSIPTSRTLLRSRPALQQCSHSFLYPVCIIKDWTNPIKKTHTHKLHTSVLHFQFINISKGRRHKLTHRLISPKLFERASCFWRRQSG